MSDAFDSPDVPTFDAICDEFSGLVDLVTLDCGKHVWTNHLRNAFHTFK